MHYSAHKYDTPQSKTENDFQIKNECKKEKKKTLHLSYLTFSLVTKNSIISPTHFYLFKWIAY